jgi:hypothetical protein
MHRAPFKELLLLAFAGVVACDAWLGLPSYRRVQGTLASIARSAESCAVSATNCPCPDANSLPAELPTCRVLRGRVVLYSRPAGCRERAFVLDRRWNPEFPRDERAVDGVQWVSDGRRVDSDWVQLELSPCLD